MVVTEGPNRYEPIKFLASCANLPTYPYLYTLFRGKFRPVGSDANVYWTHVRKCFLDGLQSVARKELRKGTKEDVEKARREMARKALRKCKGYLEYEVKAVRPKLILAVGREAWKALRRGSKDQRLRRRLEEVFEVQLKGPLRGVDVFGVTVDLAVVPHPSGRNRFWNNPPSNTPEILNSISEAIIKTIKLSYC